MALVIAMFQSCLQIQSGSGQRYVSGTLLTVPGDVKAHMARFRLQCLCLGMGIDDIMHNEKITESSEEN